MLGATQTEVAAGEEDCLALNIWVPRQARSEPLPVMVFIHGGGFKQGSGSRYDGAALAERGRVIVVTFNYRLGVFGFLAHPALSMKDPAYGASGNYGLLDQIAALRWIQTNIRAFGGNPGNITIFGESGGSISVCNLVASPLARGLFHRAIMQSGTCGTRRTLREAEMFGVRFAKAIGCENTPDVLGCLRRKSRDELLNTLKPPREGLSAALTGRQPFSPSIDGKVLPANPVDIIQSGRHNAVPMMLGVNANEATIFLIGMRLWSESAYRTTVREVFGDRAARLLEQYPATKYRSPREAYDALLTDVAFVCPTRAFTRAFVMHQPKTFLYRFTHTMQSGQWVRALGAFHGLELAFVFRFGALTRLQPTGKERVLSDTIADYWAQFARSGDPNMPGLPHWPPYTLDGEVYQVLDIPVTTKRGLGRDACQNLFPAGSTGDAEEQMQRLDD